MPRMIPQRIVKIETLCISHLLLLRVHTDQGLIGCGESYYVPQAVSSMLHDWMSNRLIGANAVDIEIMLDGHGFFQWPAALRIAEVMREIKPLWMEDVLRVDNIDTLKAFRDQVGVPIAVTEMFTTREDFRHVLEKRAADYVMVDPTWVGGISETKRISDMVIPYNIPVAMHDCTGPLTLLAGLHVGAANHNVVFQETVRAHLRIVYPKLIDQKSSVLQGTIAPPDRVGISAAWLPGLFSDDHASYRITT